MNITKHHFYMEMFSLILSESFSLSFFFFGCIGSSLLCVGFSLRWLLLLQSTGSVVVTRRLSSCGTWA